MGMFSWFRHKNSNYTGRTFTDEDRDTSAEIRAAKKEIALLKLQREDELHKLKIEKQRLELQAEIEDLRAVFEDSDDNTTDSDDITATMLKIFGPAIAATITPKQTAIAATDEQPQGKIRISDDELKRLWDDTPKKYKIFVPSLDDATIKTYLLAKMPNLDEDTQNRALKIVRGQP